MPVPTYINKITPIGEIKPNTSLGNKSGKERDELYKKTRINPAIGVAQISKIFAKVNHADDS